MKEVKNLSIWNPRRAHYHQMDPSIEREQITWEFRALNYCNNHLFYFSYETLAPITLLEYGKALNSDKNLFVCLHPEYKRRNDVIIQTELQIAYVVPPYKRKIVFFDSLEETLEAIKKEFSK